LDRVHSETTVSIQKKGNNILYYNLVIYSKKIYLKTFVLLDLIKKFYDFMYA